MAMKDGTCSVCGSSEVYQKQGGVVGYVAGVFIQTGLFTSIKLDSYVCLGCGYVELGVPAYKFDQLRKALNKQGWWRVQG